MAIAVCVAMPWLDQRLFWCEWMGLAVALLLVRRIRGWWGEAWTLAGATAALAIAFHWTPKVLAYAMNTDEGIAFLFATPIVLWDALRLACPLWFAARVARDPLSAWWPAGLAAAALEAAMPAIFPWKLGYSQIGWPVLVQSVDLFGPEFSTVVLFAHAGAIVWLVSAVRARWTAVRPATSIPGLVAVAVCVANAVYGTASLAYWGGVIESAPRFTVALVQANPEDEGGVDSLRRLTQRACAEPGPLLFGGKIYTGHPDQPRTIHQSAILLDRSHAILGRYHKRHLMPFGEYVPGGDIYPDIKLYFPMQDEMTEGTEATVLPCGHAARLGVMLCYEDMIPGAARSLVASSANVLVSLINGSAFTETLTLQQHRMLAQLRAVECRRALLRCAATGETCVISPMGTVTARLPLHDQNVLVAHVPLLERLTLASRIGAAFPAVAAVGALAIASRRLWSNRSRHA